MTAPTIIERLRGFGVRVLAENGNLVFKAAAQPPAEALALVSELKARKAEALAHLTAWPGPCYCCGEVAWWLGADTGVIVCGRCHPPMFTHHVAAWVPQAARTWPRQ
ncbi:MAG: hypothetical protein V2A77_09025 [Pseudomonadota bacterium]